MSCRKPVLMVIDGISRELVEKADAGLYAEPENPEEFSEKVLQYAGNPGRIRAHGENGYNHVREHFDRTRLAKQYLEYVQQNI